MSAEEKPVLTERLEAIVTDRSFTGNAPGGPSRWSTERSSEWVPVKPKLVIEVSIRSLQGRPISSWNRIAALAAGQEAGAMHDATIATEIRIAREVVGLTGCALLSPKSCARPVPRAMTATHRRHASLHAFRRRPSVPFGVLCESIHIQGTVSRQTRGPEVPKCMSSGVQQSPPEARRSIEVSGAAVVLYVSSWPMVADGARLLWRRALTLTSARRRARRDPRTPPDAPAWSGPCRRGRDTRSVCAAQSSRGAGA